MMIPRIPAKYLGVGLLAAISLIVAREDIRLDAFKPFPWDVWTIAGGTTVYPDGKPVKPGDKITPKRAVVLIGHDVDRHAAGLHRCIGEVPLYQHEFDAYVALAINVGVASVCNSSIPRKLMAGQYQAACATIKDFNKGGPCLAHNAAGKCVKKAVIQGLVNAREREYQWCMGRT